MFLVSLHIVYMFQQIKKTNTCVTLKTGLKTFSECRSSSANKKVISYARLINISGIWHRCWWFHLSWPFTSLSPIKFIIMAPAGEWKHHFLWKLRWILQEGISAWLFWQTWLLLLNHLAVTWWINPSIFYHSDHPLEKTCKNGPTTADPCWFNLILLFTHFFCNFMPVQHLDPAFPLLSVQIVNEST